MYIKFRTIAYFIIIPALFAFLLFAASGCHPYYNTFYNAEEAFQIAQREHNKVKRAYPDSIVVEPPGQSAAMYDRAIEKSLKMMEVFPREQKRLDNAHYLMGRASFYKKDFPVALGRMRDLQTLHPESPLVPPSQIYVAKSHIMMDNLAIAEEILLELLRTHPQLDRKYEITMLLVEIAIRRGGRSQALGLLEGIARSSLPLVTRLDIILRMADLNYELRQYDAALGLLRSAPRAMRKHPYLMYRVDRAIYFCYDAMDSLDVALEHLWVMQRNRRYADQRYEIMFYRAVTLRRLGRFDEAIALLEEIGRMCSRTAAAPGAGSKPDSSSLCGRSSYELAHIYLELGDLEKAMAAFEAASKTSASVGARASARLLALRKLKELRTPDSLGNIPPEARYSIAELFRYELEAPDSSYTYYMELAGDTAAADSIRPRALLSAAVVARYQLMNEARADSLLKLVLAEYEGTEYARLAQIELDMEVTVVTERETAERAFRDAEALVDNDPVEAVKALYNVYVSHPDMEVAPRSLHAAAWYTDNILHRNRAAMTLYEELCDKYPESVYCVISATPRLAVARDSIEARRQRREAARGAGDQDSASVGADTSAADTSSLLPDGDVDPAKPAADTDSLSSTGADTPATAAADTSVVADTSVAADSSVIADTPAAPSVDGDSLAVPSVAPPVDADSSAVPDTSAPVRRRRRR